MEYATPHARGLARQMRREMTRAEARLWRHLKARQIHGAHFRRQHPVGPYIADFACVRLKLIIEADGDTHASDAEIRHDRRRTRYLERLGWTALRFWNIDIYTHLDGVLERIGHEILLHRKAGEVDRTKSGTEGAAVPNTPSVRCADSSPAKRGSRDVP